MSSSLPDISPTADYPRLEKSFPAAELRELAKTNYRISILYDIFGYSLFVPIAYVYFAHIRVGGPPADHWLSSLLPYYPGLVTGQMALFTLILIRPLSDACRMLGFNYYVAPIVAVLSVVLAPCLIGYAVMKMFQFMIRRHFAEWNLPCAWIHFPPRKTIRLIDEKEKQLASKP